MQPRTTRRTYATRRKRSSPIKLGVDPNADPSQSYNTGVAGGGIYAPHGGVPGGGSGPLMPGGGSGPLIPTGDGPIRGRGRPRPYGPQPPPRPYGPPRRPQGGLFGISLDALGGGGINPGGMYSGGNTGLPNSLENRGGLGQLAFSTQGLGDEGVKFKLGRMKTSAPPYLEDSSDSSSGGSGMGGTYTIKEA